MNRPLLVACLSPKNITLAVGALFAMMPLAPAYALPDTLSPVAQVAIPVPHMVAPAVLPPLPPELWANLTPEERERMRGQIRQHWEQLPAEERERRREMRRQWDMGPPPPPFPRRGEWQQISPEERQQIRDMIRERRGFEPPEGRR